MTKYITEILDELNAAPAKLQNYAGNPALKIIFEHAFLPEKKFLLPEGDPPFKPDSAPIGMTPTNLYQEVRRLYIYCRADLTALRRETLFVQFLETIHPSEAALALAIKDQRLHKIYPKLTHKVLAEAGFIPHPLVKEKTAGKNTKAPADGATQSPDPQ